jgi:hypothetical protein
LAIPYALYIAEGFYFFVNEYRGEMFVGLQLFLSLSTETEKSAYQKYQYKNACVPNKRMDSLPEMEF